MPAQTGSKPLPGPVYAVAGVGDLLAEQVRRLVANAPEIQAQIQRNAAELPEELRALRRDFPRDLRAFAADLPSYAADLPSYAADLQSKARDIDGETVRRNLTTAQTKAQDLYRTLVQRGEQAVKQPGDTPEPPSTPPVDGS